MFKYLFILLPSVLFGVDINIYIGKENNASYSNLHIRYKKPFHCKNIQKDPNKKAKILCTFNESSKEFYKPIFNDFFKIKTYKTHKNFFIEIVPIHKIKAIAIKANLNKKNTIKQKDINKSKHWLLLGFKDKYPLIEEAKRNSRSIKFPIKLNEVKRPFIGAIDTNLKPISDGKTNQLKAYQRIKSLYKRRLYEDTIKQVNDILSYTPDTLFNVELDLYKLRAYYKLEQYEKLLEEVKIYNKKYYSTQNQDELLLYIAISYSKEGILRDSKYFFNRLFDEYPKSEFTNIAFIHFGDQNILFNKKEDGLDFYKKALYNSKNIENASMAALRLVNYYMTTGKTKAFLKFLDKILNANPKYFTNDIKNSMDIGSYLLQNKKFIRADKLYNTILKAVEKEKNDYEKIMTNIGISKEGAKDTHGAYKIYKKYLKEYPYGIFVGEIENRLDSLFFSLKDINNSDKIQSYDKLRNKYGDNKIGQRAIFEKANFYNKNKEFNKTLNMQDELLSLNLFPQAKELIKKAAYNIALSYISKNNCKELLNYIKKYKLNLKNKADEVYNCSFKEANFKFARDIAKKNLEKKSNKLRPKLKWLYNYAKSSYKVNDYKNTILAAEDIIKLANLENDLKYKDILYEKFKALKALKKYEEALKTAKEIEDIFSLKLKFLDLYFDTFKIMLKEKNYIASITYAKKILYIQNENKTFIYSPFIDFSLIQIYKNIDDRKKAFQTILNTLKLKKISNKDKARLYYELANYYIYIKNMKDAKKYYEKSIQIAKNSPWAKLSKDALKLIN